MKRIFSVGIFCIMSALALMLWQQAEHQPTNLPAGALNAQESSADASDVDISAVEEMTLGPKDAKVTVTEYASFTCPHCAHFHETTFKELKRDYIDTGKIHFVFRDVYFDKFGLWASLVARCEGPSKFFGVSGMIFDQQKAWVSGKSELDISNNLRKIGKAAGMTDDKVEACLDDAAKAKTLVAWYLKNFEADGVSGTPTLIINGEKHQNMPYSQLKEIIEAKLAE